MFKQYIEFVDGVTSEPSKNTQKLIERINELEETGLNVARMVTGAAGMAGEAGEIADLWKKVLLHGKPWNEENKAKMESEIGDCFWYLMQLCMALQVDPEEIIEKNVEKLQSRYPGGKFSIERSENRKDK